METVIRRLPEAERRQLYRDFEKIERDEPTEGNPVEPPAVKPVSARSREL